MQRPGPRILQAVPNLPHVRLEIAKAILKLGGSEQRTEPNDEDCGALPDRELVTKAVHDAWQILCKAGFNPDEPRVPAGNPDGGQWTSDGSSAGGGLAAPESAGSYPAAIWHNQGPPLGDPPEIPPRPPATRQALNAFLKAAAYWLVRAGKVAAAKFLARLQTVFWLVSALQYIYTYTHPPKTLAELQNDVLNPQPGYDIHHIVEKKSAADVGYPDSVIDGPDNLVRIPTLRH